VDGLRLVDQGGGLACRPAADGDEPGAHGLGGLGPGPGEAAADELGVQAPAQG